MGSRLAPHICLDGLEIHRSKIGGMCTANDPSSSSHTPITKVNVDDLSRLLCKPT